MALVGRVERGLESVQAADAAETAVSEEMPSPSQSRLTVKRASTPKAEMAAWAVRVELLTRARLDSPAGLETAEMLMAKPLPAVFVPLYSCKVAMVVVARALAGTVAPPPWVECRQSPQPDLSR